MPEIRAKPPTAQSRRRCHEPAATAERAHEAADPCGHAGRRAAGSATVAGAGIVPGTPRTEHVVDGHEDWLRFRVWVAAQLVDQVWLDARDTAGLHQVEQVWQRHQDFIAQAEADGKPWVIEIYDASQPEDQALRFGTDKSAIKGPTRQLSPLFRRPRSTTG